MSLDAGGRLFPVAGVATPAPYEGHLPEGPSYFQARASVEGADFDDVAVRYVAEAGGWVERRGGHVDDIPIDGVVRGTSGATFLLAAHGTFDDGPQSGLRRVDTVHKVGHRAALLAKGDNPPLLVITSHLPRAGSKAALYLARSREDIFDVVATTGDLGGFQRLRRYLNEAPPATEPGDSDWRHHVLQPALDLDSDLDGPAGPAPRGSDA